MDPEAKTQVMHSLSGIGARIQAILCLVSGDAHCIEVIQQLQEVRSITDAVRRLVLMSYIHTYMQMALQAEKPDEREHALRALGEVFQVMIHRPIPRPPLSVEGPFPSLAHRRHLR